MRHHSQTIRRIRHCRLTHTIVFAFAMASFALNGSNALAASLTPSDYRVATASGKFDGTRQYSVAFKIRPPRRLRARHLELAIGTFTSSAQSRPFVSFGPVWRLPVHGPNFFLEFGISPTLIAGSSLSNRDMGGSLHFTSSAAIGARFGMRRKLSLSLRTQHISNGGLNNRNPGLDMVGLNFAIGKYD